MSRYHVAVSVVVAVFCWLAFSPTLAQAACTGSGVTWNCTVGTTIAQVNSTLSSASDGAVLTFAAGSYSWGSSLSFSASKGATLICATPLGCVVSGSTLWQWANWGTTNKLYRISGFDFTGVGSYFIWLYGTGSSPATLTNLRLDHNRLTVANNGADILALGETSGINTLVNGVIDHNTFRTTTGNSRWLVNYAQTAASWPASGVGTANNLFIEDNTFTDQCIANAGNAALDTDGGKINWVVRYNNFTNARIEHHGYYWSFQGPASSEVYGNSITMTCGSDTINGSYSMKHQGSGEWLVFNNTITPGSGKGSPHILQNYRSFYPPSGTPNCDGTQAQDGNRTPLATYRGYPCNRQPGRDASGILKPQYYWNNRWNDGSAISLSLNCPDQGIPNYCSNHIQANRDYYQGGSTAQTSPTSPFNGTVGTGFGTLANRSTTCTPTPEPLDAGNGGVGYFATDVGPQGTLFRCSATNTWTVHYAPYTYPHPLVTPTTPDTEPPTSPTNLAATSPSQSSISVSWTASTDNVGVTGYIVERCQGSGCSNFSQVGTPTASPFVDSGLTASTFYNYHVRATDAAGNLSGWSNVVGATTQAPDTQAPTVPTNLSATAASSSTVNLTWAASTDNVAVTGYKVERCSGSGCTNFTQITSQPTTNYQDTGLTASTLYRYQVRAVDGAGNNSGYSNISSATTPVAPPSPTFISEYETAWNSSTSPKTTANFSVQSGDTLVAYAVNESSGSTIATPPTGTLTGTWTLRQTISASNFTYLRLWTMDVASNQTNVNVTFTNAGGNFGGDVLHFRNTSGIGVTAQANSATGNPTLTLNGVGENSSIVMVNGDWSARTGTRTYNTTQAGAFTETSAYADGSSYGVEAGYYANAGTSGNKTIGLTAPTGMTWALAAVEIKGNSTPPATFTPCNTVTTANFSQSAYDSYGAPFDAFQTSTNLINASCTSADSHTIQATLGQTGDTTRIVYTKGYYYAGSAWTQYSGTCTGALNGDWCQGSVSATITNPNLSTASAASPAYFVGMTCSVQGGGWKCGCRDTVCSNFYWQVQGAGM